MKNYKKGNSYFPETPGLVPPLLTSDARWNQTKSFSQFSLVGMRGQGSPQKFFQGGKRRHIFHILFRLLTVQWKWALIKRFTISTPHRKLPMIWQQSQNMRFFGSRLIARCIAITCTRVRNLFVIAGEEDVSHYN